MVNSNKTNLLANRQVTADGPAASGKSTVSRLTAKAIGAFYVNSGDLYRALTWLALNESIDPEHEHEEVVRLLEKYKLQFLHDDNRHGGELYLYIDNRPADRNMIRSPEVTEKVSFTAKIPDVRDQVISIQRNVKSMGLIVMEGRDIGTVIFPDAFCKFYITASPEERARRRLQQRAEVCDQATMNSLTEEIEKRDRIDSTRTVAPLRPAPDAAIIDTTGLSIGQVVDKMVTIYKSKISRITV